VDRRRSRQVYLAFSRHVSQVLSHPCCPLVYRLCNRRQAHQASPQVNRQAVLRVCPPVNHLESRVSNPVRNRACNHPINLLVVLV
jgi:hypothetical protein